MACRFWSKKPAALSALLLCSSLVPANAIVAPSSSVTQHLTSGRLIHHIAQDGITPLMEAASAGNLPEVRKLVQSGSNIGEVDDAGRTAVWYSVFFGQQEVFDYFSAHSEFKKVIDLPDTITGNTMLHLAVKTKSPKFAKVLLENNASVDVKDIFSQTPVDICKQVPAPGCVYLGTDK